MGCRQPHGPNCPCSLCNSMPGCVVPKCRTSCSPCPYCRSNYRLYCYYLQGYQNLLRSKNRQLCMMEYFTRQMQYLKNAIQGRLAQCDRLSCEKNCSSKCCSCKSKCYPCETQCYCSDENCSPCESKCYLCKKKCYPCETNCYEEKCPPCETKCYPCKKKCYPCEAKCYPSEDNCFPCEEKCTPCESKCFSYKKKCYPCEPKCYPSEEKCFPCEDKCSPSEEKCYPCEEKYFCGSPCDPKVSCYDNYNNRVLCDLIDKLTIIKQKLTCMESQKCCKQCCSTVPCQKKTICTSQCCSIPCSTSTSPNFYSFSKCCSRSTMKCKKCASPPCCCPPKKKNSLVFEISYETHEKKKKPESRKYNCRSKTPPCQVKQSNHNIIIDESGCEPKIRICKCDNSEEKVTCVPFIQLPSFLK